MAGSLEVYVARASKPDRVTPIPKLYVQLPKTIIVVSSL